LRRGRGSGKEREKKTGEALPFWRGKRIQELEPDEWEALCDGCGLCCLEKRENPLTGEILQLGVGCEYLDLKSCRCTIYKDRTTLNPDCLRLSPLNVGNLSWLPETCAYRRVSEGKELEWWHPLLSQSGRTVHQAGVSVKGKAVAGKFVHPKDLR
jgi:uncharacterized cysteine cluster protein YcgN (CxxCxxCC family)